MRKKIFTAMAALAMAASSAVAFPVSGTLTLNGYEHPGAKSGTLWIDPAGPGSQAVNAGIGGIRAEFDDGFSFFPEDFIAWCIELTSPAGGFGTGNDYVKNILPPLAAFSVDFTPTQETRLSNLFVRNLEEFGGSTSGETLDALHSAAVQLAVWEIIYDEDSFGSLSTGEFYSSSAGGAQALADQMLLGLDTYVAEGQYFTTFTTYNNGDNKGGLQDFLSVSISSGGGGCPFGNPEACEPVTEIPEPGTLALALGGLGLMAVRRRKSQTKT